MFTELTLSNGGPVYSDLDVEGVLAAIEASRNRNSPAQRSNRAVPLGFIVLGDGGDKQTFINSSQVVMVREVPSGPASGS